MINSDYQGQRREACPPRNSGDLRSPWERDYARIIHSAAFRRLQSKTQIFGLGDSDFYRTRLTHSMEVAQIATAITVNMRQRTGQQEVESIKQYLPDPQLINAIGLAHDLGHPPFGHGGEAALNYCMRDFGGFEGNGQTLRILSRLEKYSDGCGLNPTRRMLLGILKYPARYSALVSDTYRGGEEQCSRVPSWLKKKEDCKPPKCYLDSERDVVDWILAPFSVHDRTLFTNHTQPTAKHGKSLHKSLDTSIMELADDISYGVHDLEDAITLGLITESKFRKVIDDDYADINIDSLLRDCGATDDFLNALFSKNAYKRKHSIGFLVNTLIINACVKDKNGGQNAIFTDELLRYNVALKEEYKKLNEILLGVVYKYVIKHANVQLMELKGQKIICEIFEVLSSDPKRFLYGSNKKKFLNQSTDKDRQRVICDYIAGMTDEYATKLYEKLFCPRKGSIFDRL